MPKTPAPTVTFTEPLTSPPHVQQPGILAEELKVAGTRKRIVEAWGVSVHTYDTRKRSPIGCTVGKLQLLTQVLQVLEKELFAVVRAEAAQAAIHDAASD
ncbi:hypothetical protein KBK19_19830 [Microvirga sp. STR05]|uniref:Transcriptional regulator n=1 Tax=Hymenobacter duratus TaxID=2771356 RepID=A0ABR8JKE2_9BACT|nr:hypothetical protein [Hymenobacter duratus]MBD2717300.1 hypothetical protein [Hymenobacter duratus]MBR7952220.1 hypothetical protein [Microvirga sp. STR05]